MLLAGLGAAAKYSGATVKKAYQPRLQSLKANPPLLAILCAEGIVCHVGRRPRPYLTVEKVIRAPPAMKRVST